MKSRIDNQIRNGKPQVCLLLLSVLVAFAANAQPTTLNDRALSNITAGTLDDPAIPPDVNQSLNDDSVPIIVVAGSSAQSETHSEVRLEDSSQSSVHAANLVNTSAADVAEGVNVFSKRATELDLAAFQMMAIAQENQLTQTGSDRGALGFFTTLGPLSRHDIQETRTSNYSSSLVHHVENNDLHFSSTSTTTRFQSTVLAQADSLFDGLKILDQSIALPSFSLQLGDIHISIPDPLDLFDIDITITPPRLSVDGASINTGGLNFVGDQIILSAPSLTLPKITFGVCFLLTGCNPDQLVTLTLRATTLSLGGSLSIDNPINAHGIEFGYAIAGDGSIMFGDGNVNLSASIPLDLGTISNLFIPIVIPIINVPLDVALGALGFPELSIPINIDIPLVVPNSSIAGSACVFSDGQQTCTPLDVTTTKIEYSNDGQSVTESSEHIYAANHDIAEFYELKGEVTAQDAAAKFIVLRNSSAEVDEYSVVIVTDNAQAEVRALNMVNTANGIIGNGLNVIATLSDTRSMSGQSGQMLSQINTITQIGSQ